MKISDIKKSVREYNPKTSRIEAFSDGVFAIVVTLLVLELKVPHLPEGYTTQYVLNELYHLIPKFIGFVISFFLIAIYWVNHHQFFHSLEKADRSLLWYNNLFLFTISFIPFPTAFVGEYPNSIVAVMLYGFVMVISGISFDLLLHHAIKADLFSPHISKKVIRNSYRKGLAGPVIYLTATLSALISVYIAITIFILIPVLYFIPQKIVTEEEL